MKSDLPSNQASFEKNNIIKRFTGRHHGWQEGCQKLKELGGFHSKTKRYNDAVAAFQLAAKYGRMVCRQPLSPGYYVQGCAETFDAH
jgi:hypothetical protein